MVWTLQRYVFREMGRAFALSALGLIAVLSMGGGVFNMIQVEELTAEQLLRLMGLVIPVAASLSLPIAAMFSAASTYGRLASDNEFVACRSGGINIQVLLLPALLISLLTAAVSFVCINTVIPRMVADLDRIVGMDLESIVRQRLRRQGGQLPGVKSKRMYWDAWQDIPRSAEAASGGFALEGVAFLEMTDEGVSRVGTAASVVFRYGRLHDQATIAGVMRDVTLYDPVEGRFFQEESQVFPENTIPFAIPTRLKFLDLSSLLRYRRQPQAWHEVRENLEKLRVALARAFVYQSLLDESQRSTDHRVQIAGAQSILDVVSAQPVVAQRDGSLALSGVRVEEVRGGRRRLITADRGSIEVLPAGAAAECSIVVHLYDRVVLQDFADPSRTVTRSSTRLEPALIPPALAERVESLDDATLLGAAPLERVDPRVARAQEQAAAMVGQTVRKITGIIHQRLAFTASVFVLVTLSAALAIIMRDAHVLTAFGISFLPSVALIIAIVMGKQLAENESTAAAGLAVIWGGLAVMGGLDLLVLGRYLRR